MELGTVKVTSAIMLTEEMLRQTYEGGTGNQRAEQGAALGFHLSPAMH